MSSKSSTSASTTNSTSNKDARVTTDSGIALGEHATINYTDNLSEDSVSIVKELVALAGKSAATTEQVSTLALASVSTAQDRANKGGLTGFTDILPALLGLAGIIAAGWVIVTVFSGKKGKK